MKCRAVPPVADATACKAGYYDPSSDPSFCRSSCKPGYNDYGKGNGEYKCNIDGQWVPKVTDEGLVCENGPCPSANPLPAVPHHNNCSNGRFRGPKCTLKCDGGFTPSDIKPFTCGIDGKWTRGSITCSPRHCAAKPPVDHANACPVGTFDPNPALKTNCTTSCVHGYESSGDPTASFLCDAQGQWQEVHPIKAFRCHNKPCAAADPLPATHHHSFCPNGFFNSTQCKLTCNSGYTASNLRPFMCGADGIWTGGSLTCTPIECPAGKPASRASVSCPVGSSDQSDPSKCWSDCESGYENTAGSGSFVCNPDGHWAPAPNGGGLACTEKTCAAGPPAEHAEPCVEGHFDPAHPSVCKARCAKGYRNTYRAPQPEPHRDPKSPGRAWTIAGVTIALLAIAGLSIGAVARYRAKAVVDQQTAGALLAQERITDSAL